MILNYKIMIQNINFNNSQIVEKGIGKMTNISIDNFFKAISEWFTKDRKKFFMITMIVGFLVHFEMISKELLAEDGYWHYGSMLAKGWEISLGRFLIPFSDLFRGTIVVSILTTTLSLVAIGFSSIILNETLKIKKTYIKIAISILMIVTPTISLTFMYAYTAFGYSLALLFAVLSVYFLNKEKNKKNVILAIICMIATLGFYQAYLCYITALFAITFILKIIENQKINFKDFFANLGIIAIGMVLYYLCLTIITSVLNLSISDYSGGNNILSIETLTNIWTSIKNTYVTFYHFYFTDEIVTNLSWYRHIFNAMIFACILINFIIIIIERKIYKSASKMITIIVMLLTYPIFTCSIELIAQSRGINLLMASSLYLPIILLLKQNELLKEKIYNNILNIISFLICSIIIWTYILSNNATYVATDLYNKQMYSVGNSIVEEIREISEVKKDMPVIITGKLDFSLQNDELLKMTNFDVSNISMWTWQVFLQDNLGLGWNIWEYSEDRGITNTEEYKQMPVFPNKGYIKLINDVIVVKLSDNM